MEVIKLISEIQDRPPIWDMTHKDYSDRVKRNKCWEDITNVFAGKDMPIDEKKKRGK